MNDMNWLAVYPEIVLLSMTCVIALVDLFSQSPKRTLTYVLSLATLVAVAMMHLSYFRGGFTLYAMQGMMGSYLERNVSLFNELQKRMQDQSKSLYGDSSKLPDPRSRTTSTYAYSPSTRAGACVKSIAHTTPSLRQVSS